jgi:chromate transporter
MSRTAGIVLLAIFFALLVGLPLLAAAVPSQSLKLLEAFYRAGSLVFGGGHVVLPLLQVSVVPPGWVTNDALSLLKTYPVWESVCRWRLRLTTFD